MSSTQIYFPARKAVHCDLALTPWPELNSIDYSHVCDIYIYKMLCNDHCINMYASHTTYLSCKHHHYSPCSYGSGQDQEKGMY